MCWVLALNDVVFFEAYGGLCVCVSGAFVWFCKVGWRPRLAGGLGFVWFKERFWGRFGSDLGGVLALNDVVFFDVCGGFRWSVRVLGAGT